MASVSATSHMQDTTKALQRNSRFCHKQGFVRVSTDAVGSILNGQGKAVPTAHLCKCTWVQAPAHRCKSCCPLAPGSRGRRSTQSPTCRLLNLACRLWSAAVSGDT